MEKLKSSSKERAVSGKDEIREAISKRRDELFRSGWRNQRQLMPLVSRAEDNTFQLLVEWCEGFEEVLSKQRERLADPTPRM